MVYLSGETVELSAVLSEDSTPVMLAGVVKFTVFDSVGRLCEVVTGKPSGEVEGLYVGDFIIPDNAVTGEWYYVVEFKNLEVTTKDMITFEVENHYA